MGAQSALALAFDLTTLFAAFDPGRERVSVIGADLDSYLYACAPGPAGETPRAQAERAQAAYDAGLQGFAETWVAEAMADQEPGQSDGGFSDGGIGLSLLLRAAAWDRAIRRHVEMEYGCTMLF